jgi:hypothetical protein
VTNLISIRTWMSDQSSSFATRGLVTLAGFELNLDKDGAYVRVTESAFDQV